MKTQMKAVWAILAMATVWLTINSSKVNACIDDQKEVDAIIENMIAEIEREKAEEQETATFKETFKDMRDKYGAGYVFKWRDEYYTTDYEEEVAVYTSNAIVGGWVLNGNDPDDWCATNDRDECGECGGSGATEWYADRDGDGLGDSATIKLSCEEPSAFNE